MPSRALALKVALAALLLTLIASPFSGCGLSSSGTGTDVAAATPCATSAQCDDGNPCTDDACGVDKTCAHTARDGDSPDQIAGDCLKNVCNAGLESAANDDADSLDDKQDCTVDGCVSGVPANTAKDDGVACHIGAAAGLCGAGACVVHCGTDNPDCPDDANPCTVDSCDVSNGVCVYDKLDGVDTPGAAVTGDCKSSRCVAGIAMSSNDGADVPDDGNECTEDVCTSGVATNPASEADQACGADGTLFCDGQGSCGECNTPAQCPSVPPCELPTCEAHVCGIAYPASGTTAGVTQIPGDCLLAICDGAGATTTSYDDGDTPSDGNDCTADVCTNGVPSNPVVAQLTACAGGQCDGAGLCKLTTGQVCSLGDVQCASGHCADGFCCDTGCTGACDVCSEALGASADGTCGFAASTDPGNPSCAPYLCSGVSAACKSTCSADTDCSSGNYCKNGACVPTKTNGLACAGANECTSAFCVDSVCCNSGCGGLCDACSAVAKGQGADGTCGAIKAGLDPQNECANNIECKTGKCGGNSACEDSILGTTCGSALSCSGTTQTNQDTCNGGGACIDNSTTSCGLYVCGATSCKTSCSADGDCSAGNYCSGTSCTPKKTNGQVCSAANACVSGSCVDGVCCGSATCPACQACDLNGLGTCSSSPSGTKDSTAPNTCNGTKTCDGAGACKDDDGQTCAVASTCLHNFCADAKCCDTACTSTCQACSASKKGQGADGVCGAIKSGDDPDSECPTVDCKTGSCDGASACGNTANGTNCGTALSCAVATQTNQDLCAAGACIDAGTTACSPYVCGATVCKSSCAVDADCIAGNYCNAANACVAKLGSAAACSSGNQCVSGNCVDGVCCGAASCPACQACNLNGAGSCSNIAAGTKDLTAPNACLATETCNGAGACKSDNGETCSLAGSCLSGFCSDSTCCNTACGGACDACSTAAGAAVNGACAVVAAGTLGAPSCVAYLCDGALSSCPAGCASSAGCSTGYYCDAGGACVVKKADGQVCGAAGECQNGFCVDGVCCNQACGGTCQACTAALKGAGANGTCGFMTIGTDPEEECPTVPCKTGTCGGAAACGNLSAGTACGDLQSCAAGTETVADFCNASGTCLNNGTVACGTFACDGAMMFCNVTCLADSDCAVGNYCVVATGACAAKSVNGIACLADNQCQSGMCIDGYCCNGQCGLLCQSCNVANSLGACTTIPAGFPDNNPTCNTTTACNGTAGAGSCKKANGLGCAASSECASGVCSGGKCKGGAGQPCTVNGDCQSNSCTGVVGNKHCG